MQKIIFREIINADGITQYFIGESYENLKLVSKKTYDSLILNETKLSEIEKDIENINKNINSPNSHEEDNCVCKEYKYYLDLVEDIKDLPSDDAVNLLMCEMKYKISQNVLFNQQSLIDKYAKEFSKLSAMIDIQLETIEDEYLGNYDNIEDEYDDEE